MSKDDEVTMRIHSRLVVLLSALALIALPIMSAAQSALAVTEAAGFLGAWAIGLETPQGAMTLNLTLKDEAGKVSGSLSAADIMPEPQKVTDIAKDGKSLVLKFTMDIQGMSIPGKITLAPDGDKWKANIDFLDGQFTVDGTATKK